MDLANMILGTDLGSESIFSDDDLSQLSLLQEALDEQNASVEEHTNYIKQLKELHRFNKPQGRFLQVDRGVIKEDVFSYEFDNLDSRIEHIHRLFIRDLVQKYTTYLNKTYNLYLKIEEWHLKALFTCKNLKEELLPIYEKQLDGLSLFDRGVRKAIEDLHSTLIYRKYITQKGKSVKIESYLYGTAWRHNIGSVINDYDSRKYFGLLRALGVYENGKPEAPDYVDQIPSKDEDPIDYTTYKIESDTSKLAAIRFFKSHNGCELKFKTKELAEQFMVEMDIYSLYMNADDKRNKNLI
jgi:hypothetical protein